MHLIANHSVEIPKTYWHMHSSGEMTLDYEIPWLVPEAIVRLNELLTDDMDVLEYGSGGSTLFFSARVRSVTSFDNNADWITQVIEKMWNSKGYRKNVEIRRISDYKEFIAKFPKKQFNCVLVDTIRRFLGRDMILTECLNVLKSPSIIILDNYANGRMYPHTYSRHGAELFDYLGLENFVEETFDHPKWSGKGTRILREDV